MTASVARSAPATAVTTGLVATVLQAHGDRVAIYKLLDKLTPPEREMLPAIGHVQIASVPSRNEPDGEELNYPFLFAELDRLGYSAFVGAEYRPRGATTDGLGWFAPYAGARA